MSDVVRVLDARRWRMRCYRLDFLALGVFLVFTLNLFYDMYSWGATLYQIETGGTSVLARDRLAARMMGEGILAAMSFGWIAYRLVLGGHRSVDVQ